MATEKMSKSILLTLDPERDTRSHVAFREIEQYLKRPHVAQKLGYAGDRNTLRRLLERRRLWFREVEQLSPSVGTGSSSGANDGPNVEYPWFARDVASELTWHSPCTHRFDLARKLRVGDDGRAFIEMVRRLLDRLPEAILP
jgi:hypothetical protein